MKEILIILLALVIVLGFGIYSIIYIDGMECMRYIEANPDKNIRAEGIFNNCEVYYKGLWMSIDDLHWILPDWEE